MRCFLFKKLIFNESRIQTKLYLYLRVFTLAQQI
jgi:hypothetical protein